LKRLLTLVLTLAVSFVIASAQQTTTQSKKDQAVEKQIRQLNTDEHDAFMKNDADALAKIWSDDFVVTNPFNQFVTKQQVLALVKNGTLAFKSYERNIEYVKIYGDTVIAAGSETCVWGGKIPIAGQESHLRFTSIWRKQGGKWQELARHANIIPASQAKPKL
jgi:ketosteroid isomerase-like protein